METNNKKWMDERSERVAKAFKREEVDKTPFMFIADQYYPYYLKVDRSDVTSLDIAADIVSKVDLDLKVDTTLFSFEPVNLTVKLKRQILGGGSFIVQDNVKVQSPDKVDIMEPTDYPELIKQPSRYLLNTIYKRRFSLLEEKGQKKYEGLIKALELTQKNAQLDVLCQEKGSHILNNGGMLNPVDFIFDFLREFKGIINDIRRSPDLVRDAGLAIAEEMKLLINTIPPVADKAIFIPMHIPPFIRPKDFEKVYWPSFKLLADYMVARGNNIVYYFEKNYSHLYDYLQDLPKKNIVGIFQEDNLRTVKKKLGDTMTIAGGLSTSIMGYGTKQECIDHVKSLIDDLAPGGGYFIAPDTPMMFSNDAQPENLKAVADYIFETRK